MPEPKRPLKVFLCHASTDKPKVRELYRYLKRRGIQPWFDEEHLVGGQDWQVEIPKALATSDAIIICLTKNSVDKEGYIQKEIKFALDKALEMPEGRIFLIPVKFEECEVPFSLSRYQWVDLTVESGYAKMMKALKFRASQLERSTVEISKKDVEEENLVREKKEEKHGTAKPKAGNQVAYWFGGLIVLILGIVFLYSLNNPSSTPQPMPESTQAQVAFTSTYTDIVEPNTTLATKSTLPPTDTPTPLPSETVTSTAIFGVGSKLTSEKDGMVMVYVPEGKFTMGPDENKPATNPAHNVYLDAIWVDSTEVTNGMYMLCYQSGECPEPYHAGQIYTENPVTYVSWSNANLYCEWAGRRLPTEAEWEKAARGLDGFTYSWGNEDDCRNANALLLGDTYCRFSNSVVDVGTYPASSSPFGALDMIGNVWEWVADWYDEDYYTYPESETNPLGPTTGNYRVIRGGSFYSGPATTWFRSREAQSTRENHIGFRCAMDAVP